jgi:acyl-CoA thioesterase
MKSPREIAEHMLNNDAFSRWLGIKLVAIDEGFCELSMTAREEMLNGFYILHGGISYSLADSALAFAANAYGQHALSVETSISHHAKVQPDEEIRAVAHPIFKGKKFSSFQVLVSKTSGELIASFKGSVYHAERLWNFE